MVDVSNIFYPTLTLPLSRGGNWIDENYGIPLFKHPLREVGDLVLEENIHGKIHEEREKNEPSTPELSGHQTKWNINLWLLSAVSLYLEFWKP
ncbi:hypothetical protein [Anabaena sp. AL09]|uniref:hypothetical protein n=1 Tax=Anabaena sp. AL09 TaxID=1710891 RepID=UPI0026080039|nr:hypothetical protein [Anabaena sp. AL09]